MLHEHTVSFGFLWHGRHENIGGSQHIKADCPAIDLDHALTPAPFAEQFQFGSRQYPQTRHSRAGGAIAIDSADPESTVAAGFMKGGACLLAAAMVPPAAAGYLSEINARWGMIIFKKHRCNQCGRNQDL